MARLTILVCSLLISSFQPCYAGNFLAGIGIGRTTLNSARSGLREYAKVVELKTGYHFTPAFSVNLHLLRNEQVQEDQPQAPSAVGPPKKIRLNVEGFSLDASYRYIFQHHFYVEATLGLMRYKVDERFPSPKMLMYETGNLFGASIGYLFDNKYEIALTWKETGNVSLVETRQFTLMVIRNF